MSYEETLEYMYSRLPMFTRIGSAAFKKDLHNTLLLCEACGNPHNSFNSIHIAGTNGKGSTSHLIASVLFEAGYKTGLYTSPHLVDFRERIRVNGEKIDKQYVVDFVANYKEQIQIIQPSFFEMTVAMSFEYFAAQQVDVAVIETGLGGRLDSTNIIRPQLSVITNIGFDHMDILGNTLQHIASEKAGIIKPDTNAVVVRRHPETDEVFIHKAKQVNAPLEFAANDYEMVEWNNVGTSCSFRIRDKVNNEIYSCTCPLTGEYQKENFIGVLAAVLTLKNLGYHIKKQHIEKGFLNVIKNTGLRGRWEILRNTPKVICDTGHNEDGIRNIVSQLKKESFQTLRMVIGMVKDKDISKILKLLPSEAVYYFCKAGIPRAMDAATLQHEAAKCDLKGEHFSSVEAALSKALKDAANDDLVFIGGSTFVVAEALA